MDIPYNEISHMSQESLIMGWAHGQWKTPRFTAGRFVSEKLRGASVTYDNGTLLSYQLPIARRFTCNGVPHFLLLHVEPGVQSKTTTKHINEANRQAFHYISMDKHNSSVEQDYVRRVYLTDNIFSLDRTREFQLTLHKKLLDKASKARVYSKDIFQESLTALAKSEWLKDIYEDPT